MSSPGSTPELYFREVTADDLEEILFHRRQMFHDMGHKDPAVLDAIVHSSRAFVKGSLVDGCYRGWFAVTSPERVAAGVGLLITPWVSGPLAPEQAYRAYLLNVYTDPRISQAGFGAHAHTEGYRLLPYAWPQTPVASCQQARSIPL